MRNTLTRMLSLFLTFTLLLASVPLTIFAEGSNVDNGGTSETNVNASTESTTIDVESNSGLGGLINNTLEQQEATEEDEDIQNHILDIVVDENIATVFFNNSVPCKIIVAIYDETTSYMMGSGMAEFEINTDMAEITLDIATMPEYFIVRAFLLDMTNKPLHSSFESIEYTKAHQEFLATTTEDFDADKVVNFDDDITNNFAVFKEETVFIIGNSNVNILTSVDEANKNYSFENADDSLLALTRGDVFYYTTDDIYIIGCVSSIVKNGTNVTIVGKDDLSLKDVFDVVKIHVTTTNSNSEIDTTGMDEGVEYLGKDTSATTYAEVSSDLLTLEDKWNVTYPPKGEVTFNASLAIVIK